MFYIEDAIDDIEDAIDDIEDAFSDCFEAITSLIEDAFSACRKKWRNSYWRRKRSNLRILKTMRKLLTEDTTKLGRKTRRHFNSVNRKVATLRGLVVVGSALIMAGILFRPVKTVFVTNSLWLRIALAIVSLALGFVFLRILGKERKTVNRSRLPETIGPIGKVMKSFLAVTNGYVHTTFKEFYQGLYFTDSDNFEDSDYWTDSELGRFMKLAIAYLFIYVFNDYRPSDEDVDKFLRDSHARETVDEIMEDVKDRKKRNEERIESAKKDKALQEKKKKSAIVDEMTRAVVEPKPDHTDPDLARINDQAKVLKDKASELVARSDSIPQLP